MTVHETRRAVACAARWLERLARWCAYAAAVGIFGIAALLTVSSIKRYLFLTPIQETEELGGLLFMATTFLALAYGLTRNRHVRLELLWRYLPPRWQSMFSLVGHVLVMLALAVLIKVTWNTAVGSYEMGNRSVMTEILLWPWRMVMPATLAVMLATTVARFLELAMALAAGEASTTPTGGDPPP